MDIRTLKNRIIAVAAHKGGVGKSTISNTLASGLANQGERVAWIDLDPQGQDALWFGMRKKPGLANMLLKGKSAASQLEVVPPAQWRYSGASSDGALYLLPGDRTNQQVWGQVDDPHALRDKLLELLYEDIVDWIILDTPPAISEDPIHFFVASGRALLVTKASYLGAQGVIDTVMTIQDMESATADWGDDYRANVDVIGIVPNLLNQSRSLHQQNLGALKEQWGDGVWTHVNDYTAFEEAPQNFQSIWAYLPGDNSADRARARAAALMRDFNEAVKEPTRG